MPTAGAAVVATGVGAADVGEGAGAAPPSSDTPGAAGADAAEPLPDLSSPESTIEAQPLIPTPRTITTTDTMMARF